METREGEGLPLSGIAIILLLLGTFFLRETPLTGSRPGGPPVPHDEPEGEQRVPARLWQDPIGAVRRFRAAQSGQRTDTDPAAPVVEFGKLEVERSRLVGDFSRLADNVESLLAEAKDVTVFGIAVFGGPYAEDRESRLRARYAVLSALGALGFDPVDPTHIGYVGFPVQPQGALSASPATPRPSRAWQPPVPVVPLQVNITTPPLAPVQEVASPLPVAIIPYEWLDKPEQRVLLLWLEDESLASQPLQRLDTLIRAFRDATSSEAQTEKRGTLRFQFQAPASSGALAKMLAETSDSKWEEKLSALTDVSLPVSILSPSATASNWRLAKESGRADVLRDKSVEGLLSRDSIAPLLTRTIATDQVLADAVLDELERRQIAIICDEFKEVGALKQGEAVCEDHRDHIVLLAEWDTFYGRAMPAAFTDALGLRHRSDWLEAHGEIPWVRRVSFLRGLDGKLPGEAFSENNRPNNSAKGRGDNTSEAERPVGTSQFDYLRRLAQRIQEVEEELSRERRGRIAAVGILGSDMYDKLLILQALRPAFPGTVFFTTDLDARLLEPSQFAWTRNLIVASSFGLSLHPHLQRTVPPFRDSYQSSRFLSTLAAFNLAELRPEEAGGERQSPARLVADCVTLTPRLFEIGRDGAYDISEPAVDGACTQSPIHPSLQSPPFPLGSFLLTLLATALAGLLLYHYVYPIRERWAYYRLNMPFGIRIGAVGVQSFYLLAIASILTVGLWQSEVLEEPFTFAGGVSVVPTELLRLLAGLLAVHFALESWRIIRQSNDDLAREFSLESPTQIARSEQDAQARHKWPPRLLPRLWLAYRRRSIYHWRNTRRRLTLDAEDHSPATVSVASLWRCYQRLGLFRNRFLRYLPWLAAFWAFSFVLIQLFGQPLVPARSPWNPGLDKLVILGLTVLPFLVLLIGVVDATRLCVELVRWFIDGRLVWPKITSQTWEERFGMKTEELREWLGVDFIAKRTDTIGRLVYFPFIVIFVMIMSRSTYFDGWNMPVGLVVVILSSALYAVLSAFVLRNTAEQARQAALNSLQERLTKLAGTDRERESRQLELLMERIRDIRKGAFRPWRQQPVVKALFWLVGGTSIAGLEFFSPFG